MEVKERIVSKAEELFMRYGIRSITMDDIARELAVSKKTIYQYFKDKDDLVMHVAFSHFNNDKNEICQITQNCENAIAEVIEMSKHLKSTLREVNPSLFFDLQRYHPKVWQLWQEHKKGFIIEQVKHNIERGIKEKVYKEDLNIEVLAILRVAQIEMAFNNEIFPPSKFDILTTQITLLEHFIRGIVTKKGYELLEEYFNKATPSDLPIYN
ncbi:MAG: TetR/AcrR family transcriptional regulator [Raineya sp.]